MRKVALGMVFVASSIALLHCASPAASAPPSQDADAGADPGPVHSTPNDSMLPPAPARDAALPPAFDAGARDASRYDADVPPPPSNGACLALNPCCAKLDSLVDRLACVAAVFAEYDVACLAAEALYCNNPGGVFGQGGGPNCQKLASCCAANQYISGDLSCTNDAKSGNETQCSDDLYFYQTDPYKDCL
jgi:hypothetical protein